MLELKDVSMSWDGRRWINRLSLIVRDGEMACLAGDAGCDNDSLLMAILGLRPVDEGYITVDGELLTVDSAETFRTMMAYVPQRVVVPAYEKVSDLVKGVFGLKANKGSKFVKTVLMETWRSIGLDEALLDKNVNDVDNALLRVIVLSVIMLLKKPIVLVSEPKAGVEIGLLRKMAGQGSVVLVTCKQTPIDGLYDKQITLKTEI